MGKPRDTIEFGDFQTPQQLADRACKLLRLDDELPRSIIEPTCGKGRFLRSASILFPEAEKILGFELNPEYADMARTRLADDRRISIDQADFFATDWKVVVDSLPQPILIIGNPPWVTNSSLGLLGSANRPERSNFLQFSGLDALTGKSNFDISEWILIKLADAMNHKNGQIAMLLKSAVARKICFYAWSRKLSIRRTAIFKIDAQEWFKASVDACFLIIDFGPSCPPEAEIYPELSWESNCARFGFRGGQLVADLERYERTKHLAAKGRQKNWRSGMKHDCSAVCEFTKTGSRFANGLGESVDIEPDYLYPLYKTSDVARGRWLEPRYVLVTQRFVGEDTSRIRLHAPKTWEYLNNHSEFLDRRASSIYKDKPRFSIFGIGDYSFSPWKIAVSGLYKKLHFTIVPPVGGKPVMVDDASYFLAVESEVQAHDLAALLNSPESKDFFLSHIFWDTKRPITAGLLNMLDIDKLQSANMPFVLKEAEAKITRRRQAKPRGVERCSPPRY